MSEALIDLIASTAANGYPHRSLHIRWLFKLLEIESGSINGDNRAAFVDMASRVLKSSDKLDISACIPALRAWADDSCCVEPTKMAKLKSLLPGQCPDTLCCLLEGICNLLQSQQVSCETLCCLLEPLLTADDFAVVKSCLTKMAECKPYKPYPVGMTNFCVYPLTSAVRPQPVCDYSPAANPIPAPMGYRPQPVCDHSPAPVPMSYKPQPVYDHPLTGAECRPQPVGSRHVKCKVGSNNGPVRPVDFACPTAGMPRPMRSKRSTTGVKFSPSYPKPAVPVDLAAPIQSTFPVRLAFPDQLVVPNYLAVPADRSAGTADRSAEVKLHSEQMRQLLGACGVQQPQSQLYKETKLEVFVRCTNKLLEKVGISINVPKLAWAFIDEEPQTTNGINRRLKHLQFHIAYAKAYKTAGLASYAKAAHEHLIKPHLKILSCSLPGLMVDEIVNMAVKSVTDLYDDKTVAASYDSLEELGAITFSLLLIHAGQQLSADTQVSVGNKTVTDRLYIVLNSLLGMLVEYDLTVPQELLTQFIFTDIMPQLVAFGSEEVTPEVKPDCQSHGEPANNDACKSTEGCEMADIPAMFPWSDLIDNITASMKDMRAESKTGDTNGANVNDAVAAAMAKPFASMIGQFMSKHRSTNDPLYTQEIMAKVMNRVSETLPAEARSSDLIRKFLAALTEVTTPTADMTSVTSESSKTDPSLMSTEELD